jgi:hypothetical protein
MPCAGRHNRSAWKEAEKQGKEAMVSLVFCNVGPISVIVSYLNYKELLLLLSRCSSFVKEVTANAWEALDAAEPTAGKLVSTLGPKVRSIEKAKAAQFSAKIEVYRETHGTAPRNEGRRIQWYSGCNHVPDMNVNAFVVPHKYEFFIIFQN